MGKFQYIRGEWGSAERTSLYLKFYLLQAPTAKCIKTCLSTQILHIEVWLKRIMPRFFGVCLVWFGFEIPCLCMTYLSFAHENVHILSRRRMCCVMFCGENTNCHPRFGSTDCWNCFFHVQLDQPVSVLGFLTWEQVTRQQEHPWTVPS